MISPVGYFKLHRELFSKPIWKQSTPEQKTVLMTVLAMAWFKPNEWEWKQQKFKTVPGQFVTSLQSIVDDSGKGITIQNVRSSLKRFEKLEFLTNESTKTGRLITIANWSVYQESDIDPTKKPTKTQQRGNKEVTTKEEGNKVKKVKSKEFIPPTLDEIKAYIKEKDYLVDANKFFDYYDVSDWKKADGKPVKNWKQTIVTWNKKNDNNQKPIKQTLLGAESSNTLGKRKVGGLSGK